MHLPLHIIHWRGWFIGGLIAALCYGLLPGCETSSGHTRCVLPSDCPAGQTCADGVCTPVLINDLGFTPETGPDQGPDGSPDAVVWPDLGSGDGGSVCHPNNNGKIERNEMIFTVPSAVKVTLGSGITVNLKGTDVGGKTFWDLLGAAPDDGPQQMKLEAVPSWAAANFKGAAYSSKLMARFGFFSKVDLMGVFKVTPTALQLMGAVSDKANHTRFSYDTPLDLVRFPVTAGDSFVTSSVVKGFTESVVPVWLQETYTITVLHQGVLKLYANFSLPALLVRVDQQVYNKANPLLKIRTHAFLFMAECYGVVARVVAAKDPGKDLSQVQAKERWKLAAP